MSACIEMGLPRVLRIWKEFVEKSKKKYDLFFVNNYLSCAKIEGLKGDEVTIEVKDKLEKDALEKESIAQSFEEELALKFSKKIKVKIVLKKEKEKEEKELNFDGLVIGRFNESAVEILKKVWQKKNKWGIIFIYSEVGLGKTSLLKVLSNASKNERAKYVHANTFGEEIYKLLGIKKNEEKVEEIEAWKSNFMKPGIVLLDDIQNLRDRTKTQEFLFDIMKKIEETGMDLVITSDTQPSDLTGFSERLKSRFHSGLTIEIDFPDVDLAVEITQKKAEACFGRPGALTGGAAEKIADTFRKDIRKLEGAVKTISFNQSLKKKKSITFEDIEKECSWIESKRRSLISMKKIKSVVANFYNVPYSSLASRATSRRIVRARYVAIHFSRKLTKQSYLEITKMFNGSSHATAFNANKKITEKAQKDASFTKELLLIEKKLFE